MKKILITGANSYVGTNVEKWLMKEPNKYYVETLDLKDPNWKEFDFSKFDVIFHVAGIAHVSTKKSMKDLYFKINRDLTIKVADKAKNAGVKQFIFMSSMIVYNSKNKIITKNTIPNPDNFYGQSKLEAEQNILKMQTEKFNICILRPPMIYGKDSKGNFNKLIKLISKIRLFPKYNNKRSLLYINNLAIFVTKIISENISGIKLISNIDNISTFSLIEQSLSSLGIKVIGTKIFNPFISLLKNIIVFRKIFGDRYYDFPTCDVEAENLVSTKHSIKEIFHDEN